MATKSTVLVVDDDSESLSFLTHLLTSEGYVVRPADGGRLALQSLAADTPDLILLDVRMPEMDGFEVCQRIKSSDQCRDTPVILISAANDSQEHVQGFAVGAVDFVSKPFRREELLARVRTHMELGRLRSDLGSQVVRRTAELQAANDQLTREMTKRASIEETLQKRHELFRAMFDQMSVGIVQWSLDGNLLAANRRFYEIVGYTPAELTQKSLQELTHPDDIAATMGGIRRLLASDIPSFTIEKRFIRKDGGVIWTSLYGSLLLFGDDKSPDRLFAVIEDITDRKRVEETLRYERGFDYLVTNLLNRFATSSAADIDAAIVDGLRALAQFISADYAYALQFSDDWETWTVTHEWCAAQTPAFISTLQNVPVSALGWMARRILTGEIVQVDSVLDLPPEAEADREFLRQRGVMAVLNAPMVDSSGRVFGVVGVHKRMNTNWAAGDASRLDTIGQAIAGVLRRKGSEDALRDSEERFRSLADTAPVMIWVTDPEKHLTFCNRHALTFFGAAPEEIARAAATLIHPDDLNRHRSAFSAAFNDHAPFGVELRMQRVDGEYRSLLISGVPRFVNAVYHGHVGTGVDITDVKHSYEQHLAAQKLESVGVLAAGVAHDFNNLLGSIVARADSVRTELDADSPAREDIEQIREVALRAAEIVSELMAFAGQEKPRSTPIELSAVVRKIIALLGISLAKTAELNLDLADDLPLVRANAVELKQIVMNLVTNASEALGGKAGVVTVTTRHGTNGDVELVVTDTGSGMSEETKARIFDPFFTTKFPGRGLGLSAVLGIIRRYGGLIKVESAPNQGSRFTVQLPSTSEQSAALDAMPAPPRVNERTPVAGTVLLVEDEGTLRFTISRMLRKRGFEVIEAADGRIAIELFQHRHDAIDVVFLDLTLPKICGSEVLAQVRLIEPDMKVVLTSGYGLEMVKSELGTHAVSGFIRKPYTIDHLVSVLHDAVSR